ncbi:hypothetical protein [Kitasatospora sp. NPDC058478]|uniref:hypothetical protein n=1 Tax=unclassified Kitasatospora TaxID=2633591 RepID=UPI00366173CF
MRGRASRGPPGATWPVPGAPRPGTPLLAVERAPLLDPDTTGAPRTGARGAASRVTHDGHIRVCGACALDEAVRDAFGQAPIPPTDWPLKGHVNQAW